MSETTEPQAAEAADVPAPTIDDTLSAAFDAAHAEPAEGGDDASKEGDAPPNEGTPRDEQGRFVGSEAKPEGAAAETPEPSPISATAPDYLAPYAADFAMRGLPIERAVPYLLDTWKAIENDPKAGIQWLAGRYGLAVDFDGAKPAAQQQNAPQSTDEWIDPAVAALRDEIATLKAEREQEKTERARMQQSAYQQAQAAVAADVARFEASKKGDGVDFNVLRPMMAALIGAGQAETLEQAYDMAVNAHPATRATREAALRKEAEEAAAKKLEAARRASATNVRGDVGSTARPRSIDESLARAFDQAQARA